MSNEKEEEMGGGENIHVPTYVRKGGGREGLVFFSSFSENVRERGDRLD